MQVDKAVGMKLIREKIAKINPALIGNVLVGGVEI